MATQQTNFQKLFSKAAIVNYDFDPGVATAVDVAWVDMRDFEFFAAWFIRTIGTGNLDTFSIIANSESDGSGTDATIVAHAVGSEPNLIPDSLFLECSAEQLADASTSTTGPLRYVSVSAEFATDTDEAIVTYMRHGARFPQDGLTADSVQ